MPKKEHDCKPVVYSFRSPVRCPVCKTLDTRATGTHGRVQQRVCVRGHRFQQIGEPE